MPEAIETPFNAIEIYDDRSRSQASNPYTSDR